MADARHALLRAIPPRGEPVPVDVYRRIDGHLLLHAHPDDRRALPLDCGYVGHALLDNAAWRKRLGCPLDHAKGAVAPRRFNAQLIGESQVIG